MAENESPWWKASAIIAALITGVVSVVVAIIVNTNGTERGDPSPPNSRTEPSTTPSLIDQTTSTQQSVPRATTRYLAPAADLVKVLLTREDLNTRMSSVGSGPAIEGEGGIKDSLFGGLARMDLCGQRVPATGLTSDVSGAYFKSASFGAGWVGFGSSAGAFAEDGATVLFSVVKEAAERCGYRILPGPTLGDETLRITADRPSDSWGTPHVDGVFIRKGNVVVLVGTYNYSGSHSVKVEELAMLCAERLNSVQTG